MPLLLCCHRDIFHNHSYFIRRKDNFSEEYIDLPISYEVKPSIKVSSASAIGTEFDVTPPKDVPLVVTTDQVLHGLFIATSHGLRHD